MKIRVVNAVATASIRQGLDLFELGKNREIFHDSDVYGGRAAYFKTENMQGKVTIFPSGKMISVGTKSEQQAYRELETAMKFLVERGYAKHVELDFKTRNLVVAVDFERTLNLERLSEETGVIYEPEQFPAAIVRFDKPYKASVLMFASGKAVITGLKGQNQIEPTMGILRRLIESIE